MCVISLDDMDGKTEEKSTEDDAFENPPEEEVWYIAMVLYLICIKGLWTFSVHGSVQCIRSQSDIIYRSWDIFRKYEDIF